MNLPKPLKDVKLFIMTDRCNASHSAQIQPNRLVLQVVVIANMLTCIHSAVLRQRHDITKLVIFFIRNKIFICAYIHPILSYRNTYMRLQSRWDTKLSVCKIYVNVTKQLFFYAFIRAHLMQFLCSWKWTAR